jgi:hydrogenase maturation factor HypF (carbamoyltransferase family)
MSGHLFTRDELILIDQYPRISTTEIASTLGVSTRTIYDWLIALGIPRVNIKHHNNHLMAKNDSRHCSRCGILLAAAARMDGHGWDGQCRYCVSVAEGVKLYALPLPGGDDAICKVIEVYGMACGRDDR